ncbi:MAG: hypothetical protein COT24_04160 [Candidatus Kerfeldbacteria bacterium CG08_land_8_20_14_0_20_40_16]|uniref:Uncharacterized protein n=1 Tax=Candidatus Kerfeldbacteria bacterium CG08_land_8_20_14_0_20_40_16 TaxID=2014244 RepID=A0A2H0YV24_9BACT|nr:MAG: hypothetical protein COT24_04160 [Candidatus Kerfeldbacteria bacterium CG08_land_8_20_14_0_20_40_16]
MESQSGEEPIHVKVRARITQWVYRTTNIAPSANLPKMVEQLIIQGRCQLAVELIFGIELKNPPIDHMDPKELLFLRTLARGGNSRLITIIAQPENHRWVDGKILDTDGQYVITIYPGENIALLGKAAREVSAFKLILNTGTPLAAAREAKIGRSPYQLSNKPYRKFGRVKRA